ncbi:MAG: hypothetical protein RIK87_28140 [Fuerstiella sp.]
MANPYEAPTAESARQLSRRQLLFALIFAVVILGGVITFQAFRHQQMKNMLLLEMQRARQSEQAARQHMEQAMQQADQEERQRLQQAIEKSRQSPAEKEPEKITE